MSNELQIEHCIAETLKHIRLVSKNMNKFIRDLIKRAEHHDDSKLIEPELTPFAENTHLLGTLEYDSPAYKESLKNLQSTLDHHYANNRHHPQHFPDGIDGMTLVDLIEMLCDWKAAGCRNKNGNIRQSIEANAARFNMSPQLKKIFENTVREYFTE